MFFVISTTAPPVGWLMLVVGVYAALFVPLVLWGLGRVQRRGLAWVILPVFALITSAGLWMYIHQQGVT